MIGTDYRALLNDFMEKHAEEVYIPTMLRLGFSTTEIFEGLKAKIKRALLATGLYEEKKEK